MSAEGGVRRGHNDELIRKIKVIQKKEQEQRQVLESFLAHFSKEDSSTSPSLLQSAIDDCNLVEEESRNLWNENGKLNEKIAAQQKDIKSKEDKFVEEFKRQENVFAKAQHDFNLTNDGLRKQLGTYESDLNAKTHTIRRLEDESSQLRIDAGQFESKLDSLHSEMASLDSAMASLHGELSVLQRELDDSEKTKNQIQEDFLATKKIENTLSEEVGGLRHERLEADKAREELELQLAEATAKIEATEADVNRRIQSLTAECGALQANVVKKDNKLKQQSATNQELNELVSKMHSDLIQEKQSNEQVVSEKTAGIENLEAEVDRLRTALGSAQDASDKSSRLQLDVSEKHASTKAKYANLQREYDSLTNDNNKQAKRIDRLEREKQDLLMEIASKAQTCKDLQNTYDTLKVQHEGVFEDLNDKDKLILQIKMEVKSKEHDIGQLESDIKEKDDNMQVIERQLNEEKKLKEVSLEVAKAQQRDHASRIVESNQKNSRLGTDLSAAQSTIDTLKKQIIDASSLISTYETEKDDIVKLQASTHSKLQSLEDKYEECAARLEASDAELEDVAQKLDSAVKTKHKELEDKERYFNVEMTNLMQKSKKEIEELQESLKSTKKQADVNLERSLNRARNSFQRQLEELQTSHHREVSDARNRVATVATAMEALQHELAAECTKSSEVMAELDMLRELTDNKSSGAEETLARLEKDRTKERNNFENFISNLKNQVKSGNKTSSLLQQQLDTAIQQLQVEKDEKKKLENNLHNEEEALSKQILSTEALESEIFSLKRQICENDKKVAYQVQQKTDEIQRVTRRNEVLSEAVTRLTQMNNSSSDRGQNNSVPNDNKYIFDDSEKLGGEYNPRNIGGSSSSGSQWGTDDERKLNSISNRTDTYDGRNSNFQMHDNNHHSSYGNTSIPVERQQQQQYHPSSHHDQYDTLNRKQRTPTKSVSEASYRNEQELGLSSPGDVNSSLLRVQQALDSRRKQQQSASGSNSRGDLLHTNECYNNTNNKSNTINNSDAGRSQLLMTPERVSKTVGGAGKNVPKLNFDSEYENEISEDRSPRSGGKDGGLFAVRIRDEVEQGKDSLLPFSPKSASKQSQRMGGGCKTEREVRQHRVHDTKPDRALSAPVERMSREKYQ